MALNGDALLDSCWNRQFTNLYRCLTEGVPADWSDVCGATPLQICAALGWTEAVSLLIEHGATINKMSPLGWTALMQAVRNGHTDVVEILLKAGANINDRNALGWSVASLAVASGKDELLTMVVQNAKSSELTSALSVACQLGRVSAVKYLIDLKVDVNSKLPQSGISPLMLAASNGHSPVVKILIAHGANRNLTNLFGLTASDMALSNGHSGTAALLSCQPKTRLPTPLTFSIPLLNVPDDGIEKLTHPYYGSIQSYPFTPVHPTNNEHRHSPQIFTFSPTPTCGCAPANAIPQMLSPCHFTVNSKNYSSPYHLVSPFPCDFNQYFSPSPLVPPWLFTCSQWQYEMNSRTAKERSLLPRWWKKLKKRLKKRKIKRRMRAYISHARVKGLPNDRQIEELLSALNLEHLIPVMKSHEIDIKTFLSIQEADLEELGINDKSQQISILQKINVLKCKYRCY